MIITHENGSLPADIQKQLDNANNAVTLANAEVIRLHDLRLTEETTIIELNKQIMWGKEQVEDVMSSITKLKEDVIFLTTEKNTLVADIETRKLTIEEESKSMVEHRDFLNQKQDEAYKMIKELNAKNIELKERETSIEEREIWVTTQITKANTFIKDICSIRD